MRERIERCADFNRHQGKEIRLTTLPIQFGAGLVASTDQIAGADFDRRNTRMRMQRIGMDSICRHN